MSKLLHQLACAAIVWFPATIISLAQTAAPVSSPVSSPGAVADVQTQALGSSTTRSSRPADSSSKSSPVTLVQASTASATPTTAASLTPKTTAPSANAPLPAATSTISTTTAGAASPSTTVGPETASDAATENGGVGVREFQGDDVGQVLRLLARQAKINMVVSDQLPPNSTVTMRLEDVTALQAIAIIVKAKGLFMDKIDNVYYVKTDAERAKEPTESGNYQFSYARAKEIAPLIASQLSSKDVPQVDERTNTVFFRETRSNIDNVRKLLVNVDRPTKQVMIEARLVEVTANPKQSFGINWAGVLGSSTNAQTVSYGGLNPQIPKPGENIPTNGQALGSMGNGNFFGNLGKLAGVAGNSFAILSVPQMSLTLRALNEDSDAEFLANPRIVTADNQQAKIEISRAQPVPQLNFNEQTATAVFGGFQDKKFGNTLIVRPSVNKDNFVTLNVKPEISNKVGDATFVFAGATVASPVIDTRSLESNVLIRSGDTLAIGGLLQDEVNKGRSKVPILGDIPLLGYAFQERLNSRVKRNLLVFVTPTIIDSKYGTGLEDQVTGLRHVGEEYADINGWRNNAKGAVRLVPTANRQVVSDYPKPGAAPPPISATTSDEVHEVQFKSSAKDRDF